MNTQTVNKGQGQEFGKIRAALWPIHGDEMKKFMPMCMMMFFILFNYTILRSVKDALLITVAGAAIVPFLKGYVVMPAAILFVVLYTKLLNVLSREAVFQVIVGSFITFFGAFAFIIFPNRDFLHPDPATIEALKAAYPNIQHLISIYAYWSYSIFYTLAELWGGVLIALLFWQFANEITRTGEAKRFYPLFGLLGNFGLILSGFVLTYFSAMQKKLGGGDEAFAVSLYYTLGFVIIAGLLVMYLYYWMNKNVLTDPKYYDAAEVAGTKKAKKPKLSVVESFKYILSSKYLGFIALLILAYGVSMNLIELNWKEILREQYPTRLDYQEFMGYLQYFMGTSTIFAILFFKGIIRKFGWFAGAILTPLMMLVTGSLFFSLVLFEEWMTPMTVGLGVTSIMLAVMVGTAQNVLSKGTKYALFDPTKEMAYIPLDQELKTKGKAAVDVIGGRLGKAGGGYFASILLVVTAAPDILSITPVLAGIVLVVILLWIVAVSGLNRMYQGLIKAEKDSE